MDYEFPRYTVYLEWWPLTQLLRSADAATSSQLGITESSERFVELQLLMVYDIYSNSNVTSSNWK